LLRPLIDKYNSNCKMLQATSFIGAGNIAAQGFGFLFFVILTWFYSKDDYGSIRYMVQIGGFIATVVAAGYPTALARFVASSRDDESVRDAYISSGAFAVAIILILATTATLVVYNFNLGIVSIVIGTTVVMVYLGLLRGFLSYNKIALFNLGVNLVKILLVIFFVMVLGLTESIIVVLIYALGGLIIIAIMETYSPLKIQFDRTKISKDLLIKLTRFSIFIMIGTISFSSMSTISFFILERDYGYSAIADFSVAMTLLLIYGFIPGAINIILMPNISFSQKDRILAHLKDSIALTFISSLFIFLIVAIFGRYLISALFGAEYLNSYPILLALSLGGIANGFRSCFAALWEGINRPEITSIDISFGAIVVLISSLLLSQYGIIYLAWAYSAGFISTLAINLFFFIRWRKIF